MSSQITDYTSTRIFVRNFRVNMVAAIDWCSHTTHEWIWLVSCFGFNGPLRQYFSLYRTVFRRGRKKREKIDETENVPHLLQAQIGPWPTIIQVSRTSRESLPSNIAPPTTPLMIGLRRLSLSPKIMSILNSL